MTTAQWMQIAGAGVTVAAVAALLALDRIIRRRVERMKADSLRELRLLQDSARAAHVFSQTLGQYATGRASMEQLNEAGRRYVDATMRKDDER